MKASTDPVKRAERAKYIADKVKRKGMELPLYMAACLTKMQEVRRLGEGLAATAVGVVAPPVAEASSPNAAAPSCKRKRPRGG